MKTYTLKLNDNQRRSTINLLARVALKGSEARAFVEVMDLLTETKPDAGEPAAPAATQPEPEN